MSDFRVECGFRFKPLETVEFTDTSQTSTKIHTSIDKSFVAKITRELGTSPTAVRYKESYNTTDTPVSLTHSSIFDTLLGSEAITQMLFIKILKGISTATPDCYVTIEGSTYPISFIEGVGEGFIIPVYNLTSNIKIASSDATTRAEVEIVIATGLVTVLDGIIGA